MTPLFLKIMRAMTDGTIGEFRDNGGILPKMGDVHCFEVSEILELASGLADKIPAAGISKYATVLPSPKTWIEFKEDGFRSAIFLEQDCFESPILATCVYRSQGQLVSAPLPLRKLYTAPQRLDVDADRNLRAAALAKMEVRSWSGDDAAKLPYFLSAMLALINAPRVVGRRQHHPHKAIERALLAKRKTVGSFPLNAWTEIKLEAFRQVRAGNAVHEARLTGDRCLHWVRAHWRVIGGALIPVADHWRGNPALGTKRSSHRVIPPRHRGGRATTLDNIHIDSVCISPSLGSAS